MLSVLAEADPLSGGAGWAGAGLLGLVLCWLLLKHLPEMLQHQKQERTDFRSELARERADCDRRIEILHMKLDGLAEFMRTRAEAVAKKRGITE